MRAERKHDEVKTKTLDMLNVITKAITDHGTTGRAIDWAMVGDLVAIQEQVKEIHDQMMKKGEYA
jgi:hypothetical protein